jgi:squalene-hopene/tetraprenyl-beta-curcumene cyclase
MWLGDPAQRTEVVAAARAAVEFLLAARSPDGWWRDYDFRGDSDEWVTAYVAEVLATAPHPRARPAAEQALDLLVSAQDPVGGWRMGPDTPPDADSTAWTLRAAQALDRSTQPWAMRARDFLVRHVDGHGGVATYLTEVAGPMFDRYPMIDSWAGWCAAHDCVTAAAAGVRDLQVRPRLLDRLRHRQSGSGAWRAYWWADAEFSTAFASTALADAARPEDLPALNAAARWAGTRIGPNGAVHTPLDPAGSPFATALAARVLTTGPALDRAVRWLVRTQLPDGGWPRSARMRVPPPGMIDPDAYRDWGFDGRGLRALGTIVVDSAGIHTTATVLRALMAGVGLGNTS